MTRRSLFMLFALFLAALVAVALFFMPGGEKKPERRLGQPSVETLVRPHSPVIGRTDAPVTIVEFFDPSCESCRTMFPLVKQILAEHPQDVRLVLRYALFHQGSEEVVRMLEAARLQGRYEPVLEAVVANLPLWHDDPTVREAWVAAKAAGLNVEQAREQMNAASTDALISTDLQDIKRVGIRGTPTFYVNGTRLERLGEQPLRELVQQELAKLR
jgi:protein-disulfide isomerase